LCGFRIVLKHDDGFSTAYTSEKYYGRGSEWIVTGGKIEEGCPVFSRECLEIG
jgi:hypothetical protein